MVIQKVDIDYEPISLWYMGWCLTGECCENLENDAGSRF